MSKAGSTDGSSLTPVLMFWSIIFSRTGVESVAEVSKIQELSEAPAKRTKTRSPQVNILQENLSFAKDHNIFAKEIFGKFSTINLNIFGKIDVKCPN